MENTEESNAAKKIIEKYRFSEIAKLPKEEILTKFKELFNDSTEIEIENDLLKIKLHECEQKIIVLEMTKSLKPKYSEFSTEWKGIEKIMYILAENSRAMLSKEIEKELLSLQPALKNDWRETRQAVLKYITRAIKYGLIIKYKPHNRFLYCLPVWFDTDGILIKKFAG